MYQEALCSSLNPRSRCLIPVAVLSMCILLVCGGMCLLAYECLFGGCLAYKYFYSSDISRPGAEVAPVDVFPPFFPQCYCFYCYRPLLPAAQWQLLSVTGM